ncbi:LysR family transcriptional regulator [Prescottella agglutinans]|uniref:DNA-binding transcriptional LysR family regulator n=1 Tax=Prescottella agglutinans TaxID=1644129 RepID=A0ABT6MC44_9NOCA|nr:LysR family transcriptional regulator [Prescottella agglutinans]MDH6281880.1 DNA-binding transcriptional LysR family regulator [Prescottella agglutinans]
MELRQLRYALAVAEERHFTRAAARLHVAQSALSHQVRQLEHELGTPLFTRTNRRVELTDAGESFVLRAREVLAATDRLRGEVSATGRPVTGTLRIGTITTLTQIDLAALIRTFLDTHPGVDVHVTSSMSEAIVEQVENGELDLGFIGLWHTRPRADLTARVLGTEQLVAVVGRDHPWAGRAAVTLRDLAEVSTVDFPEGTGARRQSDDAFAMAGLPRTVVAQTGSATLVAALAAAGVGVGFLPESDAVTRPELHLLRIADAPIRTVHMISKPTLVTPPGRAFTDLVDRHATDS